VLEWPLVCRCPGRLSTTSVLKSLLHKPRLMRSSVFSRCHHCLRLSPSALCAECAALVPRPQYACQRCAIPLAENMPLCGACQNQPPVFDHARTAALYAPPASQWISALKFHHQLSVARLMAEALRAPLMSLVPEVSDAALLAVPLHQRRLRQRGFNQSYEIVRQLAALSGIRCLHHGLIRHRPTARQTTLSKAQRVKNVRGAFSVNRQNWPPQVIIVDDVITTGNTINECARILKKAGVQRVDALAFARA